MNFPFTAKTLTLRNGLVASWYEFGDPAGRPLFFFHGWPGSGAQGLFLHEMGLKHGVRIISPERPGFGEASPQPGRTFTDWPEVVEQIADFLGLGKFHIMGMSGGGPYALVCGWAMPQRLNGVCVCCGAVPTHTPEARRGLHPAYRFMLRLNDSSPGIILLILRTIALISRIPMPWWFMRLMMKLFLNDRDSMAMGNRPLFRLFEPSYLNAMKSGGNALFDDGLPYSKPWPFPVEEINVPVRHWHGTVDENFHFDQAKQLAARIPTATFFEREEGHYSLPLMHAEEMLLDLMAMERA